MIPPKPAIRFGVVDDENVKVFGKLIVVVVFVPLGQHGSYEKVIKPGCPHITLYSLQIQGLGGGTRQSCISL